MNRFLSKAATSRLPRTTKMPAFTLYGARGSTNTDRVRLTLVEGGFTDYELVPLDFHKGELKVRCCTFWVIFQSIHLTSFPQSAEHLARHPMGKVPAVAFPDDFTVCESRAICKYLARKYSFPLLPPASDIEATAKFEEAELLETVYFSVPASTLAFEKFVKGFLGLPTDEAAVKIAEKDLESYFDVANGILKTQEYFAGKDFSLVDIYYVPLIQRLFGCGYEELVKSRPALSAWLERCMARPAVREILQAGSGPGMKK